MNQGKYIEQKRKLGFFSACNVTLKCCEPMESLPPPHLGKDGPQSDEWL